MPAKKNPETARSEKINIRATQKMLSQLAEIQRGLGGRLGGPASQSQAIAYALETTLEVWASTPKSQARLI